VVNIDAYFLMSGEEWWKTLRVHPCDSCLTSVGHIARMSWTIHSWVETQGSYFGILSLPSQPIPPSGIAPCASCPLTLSGWRSPTWRLVSHSYVRSTNTKSNTETIYWTALWGQSKSSALGLFVRHTGNGYGRVMAGMVWLATNHWDATPKVLTN